MTMMSMIPSITPGDLLLCSSSPQLIPNELGVRMVRCTLWSTLWSVDRERTIRADIVHKNVLRKGGRSCPGWRWEILSGWISTSRGCWGLHTPQLEDLFKRSWDVIVLDKMILGEIGVLSTPM